MKISSKINKTGLNIVHKRAIECLVETADATKSDLLNSQTMPFDRGTLQNIKTFVNDSKKKNGIVKIVSDGPYARRLYFHPEYNFQTTKNSKAGGIWFNPYISGNKKTYIKKIYAKLMRSKMK